MGVSRRDFLSTVPMLGFFSVASVAAQSPLAAGGKIPKDHYDNQRTRKILDKAEKVFPRSRPYIGMIEQTHHENRTNSYIPVEYFIALLNKESTFMPKVISHAPAVGIAQFMKATADQVGLTTYDVEAYPRIYGLEREILMHNKALGTMWRQLTRYLSMNNLSRESDREMHELQRKYVAARAKRNDALLEFKEQFNNEASGAGIEAFDNRILPALAIPASREYLGFIFADLNIHIKTRHLEHLTLYSLSGYNGGPHNVKIQKGLLANTESLGYVAKIMSYADRLTEGLDEIPKLTPAYLHLGDEKREQQEQQ